MNIVEAGWYALSTRRVAACPTRLCRSSVAHPAPELREMGRAIG